MMISKHTIDCKTNLFDQLVESTNMEQICSGRLGAIITDQDYQGTPLVRSTTKYTLSPQPFKQIHRDIIKELDYKFNNAMVELYDNKYCSMGFHSDLALDLDDNSVIAVYSCYQNEAATNLRKLIVKNKTTSKQMEIIMEHNSIIIFDTKFNRENLHKIVLSDNKQCYSWFGITYRLSKTYTQIIDGSVHIGNEPLTLATDDEANKLYKLRGQENRLTDFCYPSVSYTLSESDLLPIS
jgi:hypothetical protein